MATITTQTIKVDLTPGRVYPVLHVSQGDVGLEALEFYIYQNNQPYTIPSDVTAINIDGMTPVGVFSYPCTWSGNVVTAGLTATMTAERGIDICELALYDATNNKIGTCNFVIAVEESPFTNAHVSTSDMATIMAAASSAQQYELLSKSWAVGDTGIRTGEDTNNSEYWANISESWAIGGTGKRTGEDTNNSEYWSTISHQYANTISFKTYDTVAQMKADTGLLDGGVCRTLGYYAPNDGGGAFYKIETSAPATHYETLTNGLYAAMSVEDSVTVEMFGAYGDNSHNDNAAIIAAINSGKIVEFSPDKVYLSAESIPVPKGKVLNGNGTTLHFTGTYGLYVVDSGSTQDHNMEPISINGFNLTGNNSNTLIYWENMLRSSITNVTFASFAIGLKFVSGYELYCDNLRFIGSNASAIGIEVSTGDSYFNNIIFRDCHIGVHIISGSNKWTNVHGWIYNEAYYNGSTMVLDEAAGGAHNEWFNPYFDTYCKCYQKTGLSTVSMYSPMLYNNYTISGRVTNPDQAYFLHVTYNAGDAAYANRIYIYNLITQLGIQTQIYDICNDLTLKFNLTYIVASSATESKIAATSAYNINNAVATLQNDAAINDITNNFITLNNNYTLASSSRIYQQGKHIWGTLIVNYSTGFVAGGSEAVGTLRKQPITAYNSVAFFSTTEWDSTSVGYMYMQNSLSVKTALSGQTYVKIPIDYIAA